MIERELLLLAKIAGTFYKFSAIMFVSELGPSDKALYPRIESLLVLVVFGKRLGNRQLLCKQQGR